MSLENIEPSNSIESLIVKGVVGKTNISPVFYNDHADISQGQADFVTSAAQKYRSRKAVLRWSMEKRISHSC